MRERLAALLRRLLGWPRICSCCDRDATVRDRYGWTCWWHSDPLRSPEPPP